MQTRVRMIHSKSVWDSLENNDSTFGRGRHLAVVCDSKVGYDVVDQEQTLGVLLSHCVPAPCVLSE